MSIALGPPLGFDLLYQKSYLITEHIQLSLFTQYHNNFSSLQTSCPRQNARRAGELIMPDYELLFVGELWGQKRENDI